MPVRKLHPSFTFTEDRLRELQAVVPEAFADGKVNWEALREALGDYVEADEQDGEHFGLFWPGKREARRLAAQPSKGTLIPAPGEGVNEDATHNIFIEGDNLEVLKLLQKSYARRVKMIYIDPPYNTGNDFVYKDDFKEPLEDYLRKTGQAGEAGEALTSNPQAGGRFHSNWLNMMYPRLTLARNLLRDDGVIFVSIDDNEIHNLRLVMNEIFGDENFVATICWQKKQSPQRDSTYFSTTHDYLLVYARIAKTGKADVVGWEINLLPRNEEQTARYKNLDDDPRGPWASTDCTINKTADERPNLFYPIINPHTGEQVLPMKQRVWAFERSKMEGFISGNRLWWGKDKNNFPRIKNFISETQQGVVPSTIWEREKYGDNQESAREIKALFPETYGVFDTPKPIRLIKGILELATASDTSDIVLDFFAGSCTAAQAVAEMNRADGGNRNFIMVQLPESTENKHYPTIAEIGKERIRRAIRQLQAESKGKLKLKQGIEDWGFKVFKLVRSNYRVWQDYTGDDMAELEPLFSQAESPLMAAWTPETLLTETLLLEGFPLDSTITEQAECRQNTVLLVEADACAHRLWVCLDKKIKDATLEHLAMRPEDIFVCLDSALSDEAKVRLSDLGNLHVI